MNKSDIAKLNKLVAEGVFGWTEVVHDKQSNELTGKDRNGKFGRVPDFQSEPFISNHIDRELRIHQPHLADQFAMRDGITFIHSADQMIEPRTPRGSCVAALMTTFHGSHVSGMDEVGDITTKNGVIYIRLTEDLILSVPRDD